MDADSWLWNLVQQISVCVLKSVFGTGRWLWDCATVCWCYTAGCTAVKVVTKYEFVYVSVRPKTWHIFFFNTSQSLYKMRVVYYITCKPLLLSLPSITFLSVIPLHPTVWPNNCDLPKITLPLRMLTVTLHILTRLVFTNDRNDWHVLLTSAGLTACCSFSTDTSHDQASCSKKCLSCLDTVNHNLSISYSASNWTSSATDAYGMEQLYMSCCMPWDFGTCRVQQIETTMW